MLRLFDKRTYTLKFARRGSEAVNESEVSYTCARLSNEFWGAR